MSQKGLPGPPRPECQKSVENLVPKNPKKSQKGVTISVRGLFRHFFDTPGQEAQEDLFETFWGVRGSRVWRLLKLAVPIARVCPNCLTLGHPSARVRNVRRKSVYVSIVFSLPDVQICAGNLFRDGQ